VDDVDWLALAFFLLFLFLSALATVGKEALSSLSPARSWESAEQARPGPGSLAWLRQRLSQVNSALSITRNIATVVAASLGIALAMDISSLNWGAVLATIAILMVCFAIVWNISRLAARTSPERIILRLSGALRVLTILCWPVVRKSVRARQVESEKVFELEKSGPLEADQHEMIRSIFDLEQTTAREIMVPRVDIVAAEKNTPIDELIDLMVGAGYSRIPIYRDSIDSIVGVVNAKDLLNLLKEGRQSVDLEKITRPAYFIPESKKVNELLREFKEKRITQAIVVDEYGGTAGLVSIKDVLEEIVGEIANEYDNSQPQMERLSTTEAMLDAKVSIDALNEEFKVELEAEGFDTVGGLVLHQLGRIASAGDEIKVNGLLFSVLSTLGRRIQKIKVTKLDTPESATEDKPGS
jgi:putative hemolysin